MAIDIIKTEHNGPKRGKGYWGAKKDAKNFSRKKRRQNDRKAINNSMEMSR